jgi:predicted HTH domain antitoxin
LPFAPARRLADMSKADFHFLLGRRRIERQYDVQDSEKDLANFEK